MLRIDFTQPATRQLHRVLVEFYPRREKMESLIERTPFHIADIPDATTMRDRWQFTLRDIDRANLLDALLDAVRADPTAAGAHDYVREFREGELALPARQPGMSATAPSESSERRTFEKIMGEQPTFLDIAFLQAGIQAARAVARLRVSFATHTCLGTGFLVAPDLILTNHHNLFDGGATAREVEVLFDYEKTLSGAMRESVRADADPASILGESDGDWAVLRLVEPVEGRVPLRPASEPTQPDAWVAIIQHPNGLPKKIAVHHNVVTYADDEIVQYLTDTYGGSSGSPVLNELWQVVALHHAGGDLPLPGTATTVYRNQGIPIGKVMGRLRARGVLIDAG